MVEESNTHYGGDIAYDIKSVVNELACDNVCLNDDLCVEASYITIFTSKCYLYNSTITDLFEYSGPGTTQHKKKECFYGKIIFIDLWTLL